MTPHDPKVVKHSGLSADREKAIRELALKGPPVFMVGSEREFLRIIRELLTEIDSLRESYAAFRKSAQLRIDQQNKSHNEVWDENESLKEAIRIYGGHCGGCNPLPDTGCLCGFREVYKKAIKKNVGTENYIDVTGKPRGLRGRK